MWPFLGSLISGASSLLGGIFGSNSAEDVAQQNIQNQMNFAQHSALWRARDVTRAQNETGINRLTLLGAPSSSFSNIVGDNSLGAGVAAAGQDIGRAVTAATTQPSRLDQLNEKLAEAKIANVNADTVRMQAAAAAMVTKMGQPATANVPFPTPDPRGPVIPLMQRARDPRTGEIVWIPSEKAASPLQTLAASPTNAALAGRGLSEGLFGFPGSPSEGARGDVWRGVDNSQWVPF